MSTPLPEQADVDPVAVVLDWLRGHPEMPGLLGGDPAAHVTGIREAPWPHITVDEGPGGDFRDFTYEGEYEVTIEVAGRPDGWPGRGDLSRLARKTVRIVADLPADQVVGPTTPVVSRVRPSGVSVYQPLGNGQPVYRTGVMVTIRPPDSLT